MPTPAVSQRLRRSQANLEVAQDRYLWSCLLDDIGYQRMFVEAENYRYGTSRTCFLRNDTDLLDLANDRSHLG